MKKTILTFVAVAFGTCVAFAQTTPSTSGTEQTTNTEQSVAVDNMSDTPADEAAGRRSIKVEELPAAVQEALTGDEFKSYAVVTVTEVQPTSATENMAATQPDAQEASAVQYEVELMPAEGQAAGVTEESLEEGTETTADAPAAEASVVVVRFDSEGKMLSRVDRTAQDQE